MISFILQVIGVCTIGTLIFAIGFVYGVNSVSKPEDEELTPDG